MYARASDICPLVRDRDFFLFSFPVVVAEGKQESLHSGAACGVRSTIIGCHVRLVLPHA